jgi:drug/metabolite transporter (DMT)-like permease
MGLVAIGVALVDDVLAREPLLPATAYRLLFGMLALVPLNLASARHRQTMASLVRPSGRWRYALPASIVGGALAMWAWLAGFAMADIARAAVLNQLSTIWIFVLAVPFLGEELTVRRVVALAVSFGGALLVLTG